MGLKRDQLLTAEWNAPALGATPANKKPAARKTDSSVSRPKATVASPLEDVPAPSSPPPIDSVLEQRVAELEIQVLSLTTGGVASPS